MIHGPAYLFKVVHITLHFVDVLKIIDLVISDPKTFLSSTSREFSVNNGNRRKIRRKKVNISISIYDSKTSKKTI